MKIITVSFLVVACMMAANAGLAFHEEGVAQGASCHTMHNSHDGVSVDPDSPTGNPWLLVDSSPSDVCIACHNHLDQPLGTDPLAPPALKGAGNFVYLLEDNLNDGHGGAPNPIPGDAAGPNLVAPGPTGWHLTLP